MTHLVDQIAEAIVALLKDQTDAEDRVYRDREPELDVRGELPALVVTIGEDDPLDGQTQGKWRSVVRINVDIYATAGEDQISAALLALRAATYRRIMADHTLGLAGVIRTLPGGAEEVLRGESSVPVGNLRTAYFVTYQHDFYDPTQ